MKAVVHGCLAGIVALSLSMAVQAQESKSALLAQQLAAALDAGKLDSIAARDPANRDVYVGALYLPGVELLVVSAKYSAPRVSRLSLLHKYHPRLPRGSQPCAETTAPSQAYDIHAPGANTRFWCNVLTLHHGGEP